MQLDVARTAKLTAHSAAMCRPTLRQLRHDVVLAVAIAKLDFDEGTWAAWAAQQVRERVIDVGVLPRDVERRQLKHILAEHTSAEVKKRPAAAEHGPRKRTAFTRKRCVLRDV